MYIYFVQNIIYKATACTLMLKQNNKHIRRIVFPDSQVPVRQQILPWKQSSGKNLFEPVVRIATFWVFCNNSGILRPCQNFTCQGHRISFFVLFFFFWGGGGGGIVEGQKSRPRHGDN